MLQYLLRWLQSSNAAKSLSREGVFKAEVPTSNGNIQLPLVICFGESRKYFRIGTRPHTCFWHRSFTTLLHSHQKDLFSLIFTWVPYISLHFSYILLSISFWYPFRISCHLYPVSGSPQIQKPHKTGFLASPKSGKGVRHRSPKKGLVKGKDWKAKSSNF